VTVWDGLVGQEHVVETLRTAVGGTGMTHAWLFTGPPGSGRSNAAVAFAAALQCEEGGCGACEACLTTLAGSHPDVTVRRTEKMIISVDDARQWVRDAVLMPVRQRWQVIIVEDADRLHERANNALLKAIEEPGTKTVWILCAPQADDVLPTIRSRSRLVSLTTPPAERVQEFLERAHGVSPPLAAHAARASQGHIGRAKALALHEETRNRRHEVVGLPPRLTSLGACMAAATNLVDIANEEAAAQTAEVAAREMADLETIYGEDRKSKSSRSYRAADAELKRHQKAREKRQVLDVVDRSLMDLMSVYRDVLVLQTRAGSPLVNEEQRVSLAEMARTGTADETLRRIDAIAEARGQMLEFNVPPQLALEALMVALRTG
jgi:DNA polymerase III subunit delta'